ncbi:Arabinanase/levansucrase/invertase [Lyophyllum atratum]|nr:Arabinanase/levansucrase/invertase [Lyophyllum atratum]
MLKAFLLLFAFATQSLFVFGFQNPIKATDGSDPFMVFHQGYYYLTSTTWTNIKITRATTIAGLKTACPKDRAPEIHWQAAEGAWYIYYSAGTSGTFDNQRTHALKGSSTSIWNSSWSYASRLAIPNRDVWAIDSTVLITGSGATFKALIPQADPPLCYSKMNSATSVGNTVKISTPTFAWEKVGANVNEGPAAIYHGGRTWIVFSASNCAGTGYTLGRLELTGSDPLNSSSWTKYANPIFTSANGSPGHNGFFVSPSENQIWNVYHANAVTPGTCDGNRRTIVQPVNWNSDGTPNLGSPLALSASIAEPV